MAVRNLGELGINLQKIVSRLMANQDLLKLLYYTDKNPLAGLDISDIIIRDKIYNKLVTVIPRVSAETAQSIIALRITNGISNSGNNEFRDIGIGIEIYVPITQWLIKDSNLRPFAIMGEIHKSLNGKKIEGLGKISGGNFVADFFTDEMSCYEMNYSITTYD